MLSHRWGLVRENKLATKSLEDEIKQTSVEIMAVMCDSEVGLTYPQIGITIE